MKKLPIGYQDFATLRQDDCVYVDKTEKIYELLDRGKYYFLSRPRRFGKSLTVSTIREIYEGNKPLFSGLWVEDKWDWEKQHPIIDIPFARLGYSDLGVKQALFLQLQSIAKKYEVELTTDSYVYCFDELIKKLSDKHGKVVILIDEYDKPIIDNLAPERQDIAKENRELLRNFYTCVKDNDANIEFFFMTGVSRFSQTGVFSNLNHLLDITINEKYASLVGITPNELEANFEVYIQSCLEKFEMPREAFMREIRLWYNGYSWDGKNTVYNPFSLLIFFENRSFQDYWFASGSPKFLLDLLKEQQIFNFNKLKAVSSLIQSYEIEHLDIRTLFFQTGYLTIKEQNHLEGTFLLDYPNKEVEKSMTEHILATMIGKFTTDVSNPVLDLRDAFFQNDIEQVVLILRTMLIDIPYELLEKKQEHFYHALIHVYFRYLGWYIQSEAQSSHTRLDAVVTTSTHIYVFEFKLNKTAQEAMNQIKNKGYADKYRLEKKEIIGIGINFDMENKVISEWLMEKL